MVTFPFAILLSQESFVMPRNIAPGTVSSESDLVEYYISDSSPAKCVLSSWVC